MPCTKDRVWKDFVQFQFRAAVYWVPVWKDFTWFWFWALCTWLCLCNYQWSIIWHGCAYCSPGMMDKMTLRKQKAFLPFLSFDTFCKHYLHISHCSRVSNISPFRLPLTQHNCIPVVTEWSNHTVPRTWETLLRELYFYDDRGTSLSGEGRMVRRDNLFVPLGQRAIFFFSLGPIFFFIGTIFWDWHGGGVLNFQQGFPKSFYIPKRETRKSCQ